MIKFFSFLSGEDIIDVDMAQIPHLNIEYSAFKKGLKCIAGIDEAGRGAWAGPIVAAAVAVYKRDLGVIQQICKSVPLRSSKLLTPRQRIQAFHILTQKLMWSVGAVDSRGIDLFGIQAANTFAMHAAFGGLDSQPDLLLVDGKHFSSEKRKYQTIVGGDEKVFTIAAASIIAKVIRDAMMEEWHMVYREYGFDKHKGYGTAHHRRMLEKFHLCPIHRRSYQPVIRFVKDSNRVI